MARRRGKRIWIGILALLVLALLAVWLLRSVFVVRSVEVTGNARVSDEEIVRAARVRFGASMLLVDEAELQRRLNATGAVCLERVEKRYPSTLVLGVRERNRAAMLLHMSKICVLDAEGCLMESLNDVPDTDLVYVSGMRVLNLEMGAPLRAAEGQAQAYCAVMRALQNQGANIYVSELDVSDVDNLRLITRTGIQVDLGDAENMDNKIAWMKGAVSDLERRGEGGGTLDVRSGSKADYTRPQYTG